MLRTSNIDCSQLLTAVFLLPGLFDTDSKVRTECPSLLAVGFFFTKGHLDAGVFSHRERYGGMVVSFPFRLHRLAS